MQSLPLAVGQNVIVIMPEAAPGQAFPAVTEKLSPLTLHMTGRSASAPVGSQFTLVWSADGGHHTAHGMLERSTQRGEETTFEIEIQDYQELDRRRSERSPVDIGVEFGFVTSGVGRNPIARGSAQIVDLSMTGALVQTSISNAEGSLFNLVIPTHGGNVRALALCTRSDSEGVGLNFVDFVGNGQQWLSEMLEGLKAA